MTTIQDPAIPKGSTVLVTGVNGFIGTHVADQFLQLGFRVRGTVRDVKKNAWVAEFFGKTYGSDRFELVAVPDISAKGAFCSAVKGISAVIHVASDVSLDPDPNKVIPPAVDGTLNVLKTANDEPTVKRFVITSSSLAASLPNLSTEVIVTKDSWNEQAIRAARADPPYLPERSEAVYAASKALAEKAAWKFYHDDPSKRSDLIVNTVLPCANFGKILDVDKQGYPSTAGFVERLWTGKNVEHIASIPPHYAIDVQDCARLHVAAAIHPGVVGERIFAYGQRFNYDVILDIFRKRNPGRDFISNFQSEWDLAVIEPQARAEQLLRDLGRQGFTPLEESVRLTIEALS